MLGNSLEAGGKSQRGLVGFGHGRTEALDAAVKACHRFLHLDHRPVNALHRCVKVLQNVFLRGYIAQPKEGADALGGEAGVFPTETGNGTDL